MTGMVFPGAGLLHTSVEGNRRIPCTIRMNSRMALEVSSLLQTLSVGAPISIRHLASTVLMCSAFGSVLSLPGATCHWRASLQLCVEYSDQNVSILFMQLVIPPFHDTHSPPEC